MRSLYALAALAFAALPLAAALPLPAAMLLPVEPPQAAATHNVSMMTVASNVFLFDPPVLLVAVGDTVVFHARDLRHSATSGLSTETEPAEGAAPADLHLNAFNTGEVVSGSSASVVIGASGVYPYYCTVGFHRLAAMHGLIIAS